jgi:hypothetical protein
MYSHLIQEEEEMTSIPRATGKFSFMAERGDTRRLFNDINAARAWAGICGSIWTPSAGGGWRRAE